MKMQLEQLLQQDPYSMDKEEKSKMLSDNLKSLTEYHYENCKEYHDMLLNYLHKYLLYFFFHHMLIL